MSLTNDDVTAGTSVPAVVVVTEDCKVAYGPHVFHWTKGTVIEDNKPLIEYLLKTGAPVGLPKAKKKRGQTVNETPEKETPDTSKNEDGDDDGDEDETPEA